MRVAAIVVAAGRGERLGQGLPKAYVRVAGRTLLGHAVAALALSELVDVILPVLPADLAMPEDAVTAKSLPPVVGGKRRQDSVAAGLAALPDDVAWVAVHDAARALIRPESIDRVIAAAKEHQAALLALPVPDTLKRVKDGRVIETASRAEYYVAQTPQVFRASLLRRAIEEAETEATDCAQLVEAIGVPVHVVEGDRENLKITYDVDLRVAEYLLGERTR
jgi:2-C-methyl-D-erythritol 4-phosphate cytidylyltransferase